MAPQKLSTIGHYFKRQIQMPRKSVIVAAKDDDIYLHNNFFVVVLSRWRVSPLVTTKFCYFVVFRLSTKLDTLMTIFTDVLSLYHSPTCALRIDACANIFFQSFSKQCLAKSRRMSPRDSHTQRVLFSENGRNCGTALVMLTYSCC